MREANHTATQLARISYTWDRVRTKRIKAFTRENFVNSYLHDVRLLLDMVRSQQKQIQEQQQLELFALRKVNTLQEEVARLKARAQSVEWLNDVFEEHPTHNPILPKAEKPTHHLPEFRPNG